MENPRLGPSEEARAAARGNCRWPPPPPAAAGGAWRSPPRATRLAGQDLHDHQVVAGRLREDGLHIRDFERREAAPDRRLRGGQRPGPSQVQGASAGQSSQQVPLLLVCHCMRRGWRMQWRLRERFGLGPKTEVEFCVANDSIVVRKKPKKLNLRKWKGRCRESFRDLGCESVDRFMVEKLSAAGRQAEPHTA